jgi:5'-3' exonuclease
MSVDNYEGIPGVGKVKAYKILENCTTEREMYDAAVEAYRNHFGDEHTYTAWYGEEMTRTAEELMLENLRLAYMLRRKDEEYKIPKKE